MYQLDLSPNDYGQFMTIIEECDLDKVEALYRLGIKLHSQMIMSNTVLTPVEYLVAKNEYIILNHFYDLGANILGDDNDDQDQKASNLLARAIRNDSLECVEILINAGADVNKASREVIPVVIASVRSELGILFKLIELKANISDEKVQTEILKGIIKKYAGSDMENDLCKFLHLAALANDQLTDRGQEIITCVVNEKLRYDNIQPSTIKFLHDMGLKFDDNHEALKHAVTRGNIEIIEKLLDFGADPEVMMDKHESLMDYASRKLSEKAISILQAGFLNKKLSKIATP